MKTRNIFLICFVFLAIQTKAQIPNNGFENWTLAGNCLQPEGWACINDWMGLTENCYSMSRSTDHYPDAIGSYSIKIENNMSVFPNDFGGAGMVWTGDSTGFGTDQPAFTITGHPGSLCGYYKFIPQNGDTMDIHFSFYKNGVEITGGKLSGHAPVPEWTSFCIPVSDPEYADADSGRIMISTFNVDDGIPYGNSVLYVDNLSFDNLINSVPDLTGEYNVFSFFIDPAYSTITININNYNHELMSLNIFDIVGNLVKTEVLKQNQQKFKVAALTNGIYMVNVKSKHQMETRKMVIQR